MCQVFSFPHNMLQLKAVYMLSQLRTLLVHQAYLKWGGSETTNIVLVEQSYEADDDKGTGNVSS